MTDKFLITRTFNPMATVADALRGRWATEALLKYTPIGDEMRLATVDPDTHMLEYRTHGIAFVDISLFPRQLDFLDETISKYTTIVDVHFSILQPNSSFAFNNSDGVINEDSTHDVMRYWSQPEVQQWVRGFLPRVHAITTPDLGTYQQLLELNRNTVLLPDVTTGATASAFCKEFLMAMFIARVPDSSDEVRETQYNRLTEAWKILSRDITRHAKFAVTGRTK